MLVIDICEKFVFTVAILGISGSLIDHMGFPSAHLLSICFVFFFFILHSNYLNYFKQDFFLNSHLRLASYLVYTLLTILKVAVAELCQAQFKLGLARLVFYLWWYNIELVFQYVL